MLKNTSKLWIFLTFWRYIFHVFFCNNCLVVPLTDCVLKANLFGFLEIIFILVTLLIIKFWDWDLMFYRKTHQLYLHLHLHFTDFHLRFPLPYINLIEQFAPFFWLHNFESREPCKECFRNAFLWHQENLKCKNFI